MPTSLDSPAAAQENTLQLDQYVSIGRAAALLDCHQETLRRWDRAGQLQAYRTPGGQRRFKLSDINALMVQAA